MTNLIRQPAKMYCHTDNLTATETNKKVRKEKKDSSQGENTQPRNNKTIFQLTAT